MAHARSGGLDAAAVVEYLETLGNADLGVTNLALDDNTAARYVGTYEPEGAPDVVFRIAVNRRRNVLTFQRDDRAVRFLDHLGSDEFSPGGAASVRISFDVDNGTALGLTIRDGGLVVKAGRLA